MNYFLKEFPPLILILILHLYHSPTPSPPPPPSYLKSCLNCEISFAQEASEGKNLLVKLRHPLIRCCSNVDVFILKTLYN